MIRRVAVLMGLLVAAVVSACAGQAPSAASCISAWNHSEGPDAAVETFGVDVDTVDAVLQRWPDHEVTGGSRDV